MGVFHKAKRLLRRITRSVHMNCPRAFYRRVLKLLFYLTCILLIYHAALFTVVGFLIGTAGFDKDESFYERMEVPCNPIYRRLVMEPYPGETIIDTHTTGYEARIPIAKRPVNDGGFFGYQDYPVAKPNGTMRIVVLGDSFTEGRGLNLSENYVSHLDSMNDGIDVLNFGLSGLNTRYERIRLQEKALKYEPDVVILQTLKNDLYDEMVIRHEVDKIDDVLSYTLLSIDSPLFARIKLEVIRSVYHRYWDYLMDNEVDVTDRLFTDEIRHIHNITDAAGARLVLLSFKHTDLQGAVMEHLSDSLDITYIDLPEEIGFDCDDPKLRLHRDDSHPSALAHEIVALHVADRIDPLLNLSFRS